MAFAARARRKLARPQTGNVKNQTENSSSTILGLVECFLQRPTPIRAQVFACVVAVGIPRKEQTPRNDEDAVSAALLLSGSSEVISQPIFFIIFEPPIKVPSVIARAQERVIPIGILKVDTVLTSAHFMNESPNM